MERPSIVDVQTLIEQLYNSNNVTITKQIQEQLQILQRQPYAWEIASQLLSSPSDQCRFFGAHTFQVKISRDWETLPAERIDWLRDELLGWIIRLSPGPAFVTTKLCLSLIAYAFHTIPNQWPHFMSATVSALQTGSQAYHIPLDIINSTLLEFFTLVPEEISNADIIGGKKSQLMGELKEGIPLVISTLISFLFTAETSHPIKQKTLNCLQSWIQYGVRLEDAHLLLQKTMEFLGDEDLFEPAVDVLLESMQQSSWSRYNNYRDELLHCLTSDGMKAKFSECILQSDEETGRLLAKLFTAFGETYADYIVTQLADPTMTCLMEMTMQLTGFEGYFPVDQEVTEIPLNFWYVLQETLFDDNILPVKEHAVHATDGDDDLTLDVEDNTHKRLWKVRCGQTAIVMYRGLVKTLIKKACFPDELTWNSWNKDIKDKFRIWRRDLGDTMINPYYVLREDMLSIIIDNALYIINNWNAIPLATQNMEATLFALKSISEEISSSENQHITRLFGDEIFGRLPQNCEPRLKNTILLLMGSLSEWLKSHPQFLGFVMNYIVPSLSDPQLAPSASIAFSDICDTCREFLVDELETLMHVYAAMINSNIKMNIMQKVVESVADVIQVLPPERAMGPLMTLAGDILQGIAKALNSYKDNPQNAREAVLTQIQYLSACCRGIQSPNDDYQSLQERNNLYDAYASGQLNRLYSTVDGFNEITFAIKESTKQIILIWGNDEQVVKIVSQFLELGMKSTNPLLSLDFDSLILLVQASYTTSHFSCWLDTASFMMTVYGGQSTHHERLRDMLGLLTTKTLEFINKPTAMEQYPDVVDSYFNLLSRSVRRCPISFYSLPLDMINTIISFTIAGMGLQERLALKAALNFMADFICQDYEEDSAVGKIIHSIMLSMGMQIMEQLLLGIGGRVPRSFSGPLVDVLYKITVKYLLNSRQWLHILLSNDGFPSSLASPNDKEIFMKGVLGTRSLKKFKEHTNIFSIKCRGLGNASYGKV